MEIIIYCEPCVNLGKILFGFLDLLLFTLHLLLTIPHLVLHILVLFLFFYFLLSLLFFLFFLHLFHFFFIFLTRIITRRHVIIFFFIIFPPCLFKVFFLFFNHLCLLTILLRHCSYVSWSKIITTS